MRSMYTLRERDVKGGEDRTSVGEKGAYGMRV